MDVQSISQVNKKWIFSGSMIQDKASVETLREVYETAKRDAAFYARMYDELSEIIDKAREKQSTKDCPTVDEIQKLPLGERIDAEVKREYYLRDCNKISGMYDVLSNIFAKRAHCEKIAKQARAALEG